jgi:hypothetical protein
MYLLSFEKGDYIMGIASLVLGIIALVLSVFPLLGYIVPIVIGVVGIILGALGKKKGAKNATGGMVCSIIATAICVVMWVACALCVSAAAGL